MITYDHEKGTATIQRPCIVTKKDYSVTVPIKDYNRWVNGTNIAQAMPYLSLGDREFLISGTTEEGWKQLFPEEEEDEEDDSTQED